MKTIVAAVAAALMLVACDSGGRTSGSQTDVEPASNDRAPCGPGTQIDCQ